MDQIFQLEYKDCQTGQQKQNPAMWGLQEAHLRHEDTGRLKNKYKNKNFLQILDKTKVM